MSRVIITYSLTSDTCKLRFYEGNSYLNVIYFINEIKGRCRYIFFKEALATILTKKIIYFGNW